MKTATKFASKSCGQVFGGYMKTKKVFKNFLLIYKFLPSLISSIDKLIMLRGVNSSSYKTDVNTTTLGQINSIIALSERKVLLINLRVLANKVFSKMRKDYVKIIVLRFIDGWESKKIAEVLGLNVRTYFRRLNLAVSAFESGMNMEIAKKEHIFLKGDNSQMQSIFDKLEKWEGYDEDVEVDTNKCGTLICNSLMKDIKRKSLCC